MASLFSFLTFADSENFAVENSTVKQSLSVKAQAVDSATLARLIKEVRNEDLNTSNRAYDRVHNRHNR